MDLDDVSDAGWYLKHNPPVHELIGDYLSARKRPDEETQGQGSREELATFANLWRGSMQ